MCATLPFAGGNSIDADDSPPPTNGRQGFTERRTGGRWNRCWGGAAAADDDDAAPPLDAEEATVYLALLTES